MILHIMGDGAFTHDAIAQFEAALPGKNEYVSTCRHLQHESHELCVFASEHLIRKRMVANGTRAVIFHSLSRANYRLLSVVPRAHRVAWIGWGYDYYPLISRRFGFGDFLLPQTRAALPAHKRLLRSGRLGFLQTQLYRRHALRFLSRIDVFAPVLPNEFPLVSESLGARFRARYVAWNYGADTDRLGAGIMPPPDRPNILVGNSATSTNNHADLFQAIRSALPSTDGRIVVPLTYGSQSYRQFVVRLGEKIFGSRFMPLFIHMPRLEYLALINSCGFMFLGHLRQQALGNAASALVMGMKLFLHPRNPMHRWFSQKGAELGSVSNPDFTELDNNAIEMNRAIVYRHWNAEAQMARTRTLISSLLQGPE